eukprot:Rhum_TRINITY_DN11983_c0_g1::Rhum_TRINITY_DN11983_c0_g1_i1::g.48355::m.48355
MAARVTRKDVTPLLRAQLLCKEYDLLADAPVRGLYVYPTDAFREWSGVVFVRQKANPYRNGVYKFQLTFPDSYPFERPVCRFVTSVYHPCVDPSTGETRLGRRWFEQLVPFSDNIAAHCLREIKRLFTDPAACAAGGAGGAAAAALNEDARAALGTPLFEEAAKRCARRTEAGATHATPACPLALRFADIPEKAVRLFQELLTAREEGVDEEGEGEAGEDVGAAAAAATPTATGSSAAARALARASARAKLRTARPSIADWYRRHYIALSTSLSGIGD